MPTDATHFELALNNAQTRLLALRHQREHWNGRLSSSALSTATAVCALELTRAHNAESSTSSGDDLGSLVRGGLVWLAAHQNEDGGWGDTVDSPSNISTTLLAWSALGVNPELAADHKEATRQAQAWLKREAGELSPAGLSSVIADRYGMDRTFSAPIVMMCALSGRFGTGDDVWRWVPSLPFELALFPHGMFKFLRLSVVSYALPALIAIGQLRHHRRATKFVPLRILRSLARTRTLRMLRSIQPGSGGFLEAAPLTSFVLMSLASMHQGSGPVAAACVSFLRDTMREDGSWPIDTNLATWVTTLCIDALASHGTLVDILPHPERVAVRDWLLAQQLRSRHPYTHSAPGGWAWTNLSGGVPDADDTAGALIALHHLRAADSDAESSSTYVEAAKRGLIWLLEVQNRDGGLPTFCKGWGKLPFDQSCPDLTAHALRAWHVWYDEMPAVIQRRIRAASVRSIAYLVKNQNPAGCWVPLWFGNQQTHRQENPLYGTARVLKAAMQIGAGMSRPAAWSLAVVRAVKWTLAMQGEDGGWGGGPDAPPSIEETALAVEAMALTLKNIETGSFGDIGNSGDVTQPSTAQLSTAIERGTKWLIQRTKAGTEFPATPIGLYFAKLWYWERLYPIIFTVAALQAARSCRVCAS